MVRDAWHRLRVHARAAVQRPPTRWELVILALLVIAPIVFNAITLLSELTIPVPSLNDDAYHYLYIQRASEALANGENILDFWLPQIESGFPTFVYYQHIPALAAVGLNRLSLGELDLLTSLNLIRYLLLVFLPLTVFVSLRWMRLPLPAAAIAALVSSFLATNISYGFDYQSYIWRGFGMYTQLWAMHLSFLTIGAAYRSLHQGKGTWLAALLLGVFVLTHLLYAYMMGIALIVIALWGIRRTNWVGRFVRVGIIGGFAVVISSYMWLPLITTQSGFLNFTPYLQPEKWDSYGAPTILDWLIRGPTFDDGRAPVLTALFFVGVVAAILTRWRAALVSLALFVVYLLIYFGRPTWGDLMDLMPLQEGLLLHRFIGGVHLAAIPLMGVGGAAIWYLVVGRGRRGRVALAGLILLIGMVPILNERIEFYRFNTAWQERSIESLEGDADAQAILEAIRELPPGSGRVYMGLMSGFGAEMRFEDLAFHNLLNFYAIEALPPPGGGGSLSGDFIWDFNDQLAADFDLWNVGWMVAPSGYAAAPFLEPVLQTPRYTLYRAPGGGYGRFGRIIARDAHATQQSLFAINLAWERGVISEQGDFIRHDYPAKQVGDGPLSAPACEGGGQVPFQDFDPGRLAFVVECPNDSTFIIKTTWHPNWQVTVDGEVVQDFMVSPSHIGVPVPAGRHAVTATYVPTPVKQPLAILGLIAVIILLLLRGRLDRWGDRLAAWGSRLPGIRRLTTPRARGSSRSGASRDRAVAAPLLRAIGAAGPAWIVAAAVATVLLTLAAAWAESALRKDAVAAPDASAAALVQGELLLYVLGTAVALAIYGAVVVRCLAGPVKPRMRAVLFGAPVVILVCLLAIPMLGDTLSYIAHGAATRLPGGGDAYRTLPSDVLSLPIGQELAGRGWIPAPAPSPYGPLWTWVEERLVDVPIDVSILLVKLIALVSTLASAAVIWRILAIVRPAEQLAGTILFLWNPVILVEITGEGHNDGPLILFALLGVYAAIRAWPARSVVFATLGAAVKYLPLMLVPSFVVYQWRMSERRDRLAVHLVIGAAASVVLLVVLFLPYADSDISQALLRSGTGGTWPLWPSIPGVAAAMLETWMPWSDATRTRSLLFAALFGAFILWHLWRTRDTDSFLWGLASITLIYAVVVSAVFWPWYVVLPLSLLVLSPVRQVAVLVVVMSIGARLIAPPAAGLPGVYLPFADVWSWGTLLVVGSILVAYVAAELRMRAEAREDRSPG